jgi:hypothetical protein
MKIFLTKIRLHGKEWDGLQIRAESYADALACARRFGLSVIGELTFGLVASEEETIFAPGRKCESESEGEKH